MNQESLIKLFKEVREYEARGKRLHGFLKEISIDTCNAFHDGLYEQVREEIAKKIGRLITEGLDKRVKS